MDKVGLAPVTYKSGKFKDMLSGERSTNEIPVEERAMVQGLIDETYQQFKGVVADGRKAAHERNQKEGRALIDEWANYADGRVFSGQKAFQYGFVDQLISCGYSARANRPTPSSWTSARNSPSFGRVNFISFHPYLKID